MDNSFICPHCSGHLLVGDRIIFKVRNKKKNFGMLLLSPEIGNYESIKHPDFTYDKGEALLFYCPMCCHTLCTTIDENLIYVIMVDEQGIEHFIYFSRISGEKSTFQVSGQKVTATGEHSDRYTYFKIPDNFRPRFRRK